MVEKIKEDMASTGAMNGVGGGTDNAPANSANFDGIGVGPNPTREPGVYPKKKKLRIIAPILKRKGQ